jgi:hypothetical protein
MSQLNLFETDYSRKIPMAKPAVAFIPASKTSTAAGMAIQGDARFIRQRVLVFIRARRAYGATDPEISEALDLSSDTGEPRQSGLSVRV